MKQEIHLRYQSCVATLYTRLKSAQGACLAQRDAARYPSSPLEDRVAAFSLDMLHS